MKFDRQVFLTAAGLTFFLMCSCFPGLWAQEPLPPNIAGLFPSNVVNPSGSFVKTPVMNVDIHGDVPNTRFCEKGDLAGTGSMRIQLHFYSGSRAALIRTYAKNLRAMIEQDKASLTPEPVHEEIIGGETALWVEETKPCIQSAMGTSHSVTMDCHFVKGEIYGKIEIGFFGEVAEAKAMLAETLDRISKTDWSK